VQTALRLTVPGVPDLYQGADLWDFSLVDPDNRRPVDYAVREQMLEAQGSVADMLSDWESGQIKQQLIRSLLKLRAQEPVLFTEGEYGALAAEGQHAERVIAFARRYRGRMLVVVACHLPLPLLKDALPEIDAARWGDTSIPMPQSGGPLWVDILSGNRPDVGGGRMPLSQVLTRLPVAVLVSETQPLA